MPARSQKQRAPRRGKRLTLSVLDLCKRYGAQSARESLEETLDLARFTESLGYRRYWIAEHHTNDAAQSSPEVVIPLLASRTKSMRIGAAGVLLQYYSPLKVAETFLALEALFPGRIDLGVCRGPGVSSPEMARALVSEHQDELGEESFAEKVRELVALLHQKPGHGTDDGAVLARPLDVKPPPIWVLGAGPRTVRLAAALGTRYAYSLFFGGGLAHGVDYLSEYRSSFVPNAELASGCGSIAVSVICAESEARANRCDAELVAGGCYQSNVVGTPKQCAETLRVFGDLFGVDEIIVATFIRNHRERRSIYRQLVEAL